MRPDLRKGRRSQPAAKADNAVRRTVGQDSRSSPLTLLLEGPRVTTPLAGDSQTILQKNWGHLA